MTYLLISCAITILILTIGLLKLLSRRIKFPNRCVQKFNDLKNKVFYNALIRYAFLNSLKINMIAQFYFKVFQEDSLGTSERIFAILLFILMNLIPIILTKVLYKHKNSLEGEDQRRQFGTAYEGKGLENRMIIYRIIVYPPTFFYRRMIFVSATVFLFDTPVMQMLIHNLMTLIILAYLCHDKQMYTTRRQRSIEISSEFLLMFISILLLQYSRLDYEP